MHAWERNDMSQINAMARFTHGRGAVHPANSQPEGSANFSFFDLKISRSEVVKFVRAINRL
jgi:hypothetical protein